MPLDPQISALIEQFQPLANETVNDLSPAKIRELAHALYKRSKVEEVAHVTDMSLPGPGGQIPIRIYKPGGAGPFPMLVYFHGGGWVFGDLDTADSICRSFANQAGCLVISVAYRLAPEHPFPAGLEDCYAALQWAANQATSLGGDPLNLAVGGDSAGGNLAAAVALMAQDLGGPKLTCQLLLYPVIQPNFDNPTFLEYGTGYFFEGEQIRWFWNQYAPLPGDLQNPYVCPILSDKLHDLPPAVIITAEYDPLRHEGEAYAKRLRESEVAVIFKRFNGMIHGFLSWGESIDMAQKAIIEISDALRLIFNLI